MTISPEDIKRWFERLRDIEYNSAIVMIDSAACTDASGVGLSDFMNLIDLTDEILSILEEKVRKDEQ